MIRAVVFDMDGVLCHYRRERRLALLSAWSGRTPEDIRASIWDSGFEDDAELGLISADDYLKGVCERLGYPLSAAQWVEARRAAIEPDLAMLALARQLGAERTVGMLTNNPLLLKRHIADVFPAIAEIFGRRAIFSSELGRTKPDPEAFRLVAARLGVAPAETVYFDDDESYVVGARAAGLFAHRAEGAASVRAALATYGIACEG